METLKALIRWLTAPPLNWKKGDPLPSWEETLAIARKNHPNDPFFLEGDAMREKQRRRWNNERDHDA